MRKVQRGSNILLDRMLRHARLADFGLAKDQVGKTEKDEDKQQRTHTIHGTDIFTYNFSIIFMGFHGSINIPWTVPWIRHGELEFQYEGTEVGGWHVRG